MSFKSAEKRASGHAPERILMAPGPSNVHPRVIQALIEPLVGHKDPYFLDLLDETAELLRGVFCTRNTSTFALPGTGGSGMEAALVNALEPGDTVVIGAAGFFAQRMVDICMRLHGVEVVVVPGEWGRPVDTDVLLAAIRQHRPRAVALVHGETSTGVEQPLAGIAEVCHAAGALLLVDAVATLGGVRLPVDDVGIDICFSGSQKCLSAPPGLAPITLSDAAVERIASRKTPVQSWYLDLGLHAQLWGPAHIYHHTSPVVGIYALAEALRIIQEEGLEERFARHCLHSAALSAGVAAMGLEQFAACEYRVTSVVTVLAPEGVSALAVRKQLLDDLNLEISAGLGERADSMWRIGVMGHSAQRSNVLLVLAGLEHALNLSGGTRAAAAIYSSA